MRRLYVHIISIRCDVSLSLLGFMTAKGELVGRFCYEHVG